jgi:hypothetical protein
VGCKSPCTIRVPPLTICEHSVNSVLLQNQQLAVSKGDVIIEGVPQEDLERRLSVTP